METESVFAAAIKIGPEPLFMIEINRSLALALFWAYEKNTNYVASFLIDLC